MGLVKYEYVRLLPSRFPQGMSPTSRRFRRRCRCRLPVVACRSRMPFRNPAKMREIRAEKESATGRRLRNEDDELGKLFSLLDDVQLLSVTVRDLEAMQASRPLHLSKVKTRNRPRPTSCSLRSTSAQSATPTRLRFR